MIRVTGEEDACELSARDASRPDRAAGLSQSCWASTHSPVPRSERRPLCQAPHRQQREDGSKVGRVSAPSLWPLNASGSGL